MISVDCRLWENASIFLCVLVMIVSFLSLQIKNFTGPLEILNFSNWTFLKISWVAVLYNNFISLVDFNKQWIEVD